MFDLITGGPRHPFHDRTMTPTTVSVAGHLVVAVVVVVLPLLHATDRLPEVPDMMAFVAMASEPPPPPPSPAPRARAASATPRPVPTSGTMAAPIEAPTEILPEPAGFASEDSFGVEGGVEGGIAGGVAGGIVGGLPTSPVPPPPPPPVQRTPVRIGGQITAPALIHRVEPKYPDIAVLAKVAGVVILEAVVGEDGCVQSVRVLRSIKFLDPPAIEAVQQWRYSPLVLNGIPTPFVLTVTLSFNIK